MITLGIISVVAAITIPIVNNAITESQQKAQYKKAYNTLYNAILKVRADMGYQMGCYYNTDGVFAHGDFSECSNFLTVQLPSKLNVVKTCLDNAYANGCIPAYKGQDTTTPVGSGCPGLTEAYIRTVTDTYVLADGTILIMYGGNSVPLFTMDINGQKPPNKWGYDIFTFHLQANPESLKLMGWGCYITETGGKRDATMYEDAFLK